jgi:Kdo2-lipid IVA lauroyltransferase/acyltransferase
MKAIAYYLSLFFIYLFLLIPIPFFYWLSDLTFFLLYHVIGYRKNVVFENLKNSFPNKSKKELDDISRRFYKYLCDLFLETFKTLVFSKKSALKHCKMNPAAKALFEKYYDEKKSVIIVMGHFGNWEWGGNTFSLSCPQQLYVIYHPLENKYFNNLIIKMRTKFGSKLIDMKDAFKDMIKNKDEINATAFIADQTPPPQGAYWTKFLNQDTPVFWGTEKIARKMNFPIVYISIKRLKRGYYELFAETLFENPKDTVEGEISETHTRRLEQDIIEQPEIWLWSHRRWKHKRPTQV